MEIRKNISELIQNGKIGDALEFLKRLRIQEFENDLLILISSFNEIKRAEINGILDFDTTSRKKNIINKNILDLLTEIEKYKKNQKNNFQKNFLIKKGNEIVSLDISRENQINDFHENTYIKRDYLDDELKYSILFNQNVIIVGPGGSGKSRAVEEVIKNYLTKYLIVLPRIDIEDANDFNGLLEKERVVVVYDELDFYLMQSNAEKHIEAIKKIAGLNNLSIVANLTDHSFNKLKRLFSEGVLSMFKIIETKPLEAKQIESYFKETNNYDSTASKIIDPRKEHGNHS